MHYWFIENPKWLQQVVHQRPWNVNVWCGILGDQIIGPFFIDGILNGEKYANFLTEELPHLLEGIPLAQRIEMWYQHDGCPAHNARVARGILDEKFPRRWIGRGANVVWPPHSPNLTPLVFLLWGLLKDIIYEHVPTTPEDMRMRIRTACSNISQETIRRTRESFIGRIQKCIEVDGHHFEHLLK
ncbi:uncharacterized protein LOC115241426 [Formica exsecta]|uniref:uncharacterized protein LOC115241426 n=1 Tax=Formica exsecta TaxID=72781 RepID=UPI001143D260|nr:uncharacterized protein LOC115241426 [Formica exsecta]